MKPLLLYSVFVVIGTTASILAGVFVEREISSGASLVVFLVLFFSNFVVSWIVVIFIMDGSLKNARGREEQLEIERQARLVDS